jgi:hypothetical protein
MWWHGVILADGRLELTRAEIGICAFSAPKPTEPAIPEPKCQAGNGRLDATMFFEARGHGYVITFGNDQRERAGDLKPFKAILATFKAK